MQETVLNGLSGLERCQADLAKFRLAADIASDHVVVADPEGRIIYANKSARRASGCAAEDIDHRKLDASRFWGSVMPESFHAALWRRIKEERAPFTGEVTNTRADGSKYIDELKVYPIRDRHGRPFCFVGAGRDITAEREIDRRKADFISLASHQLRTPLTKISLSIDILLRDPKVRMTEEQKAPLRAVHKNIHEMAHLIETLLDVSRVQLGNFVVEHKITNVLEVAKTTLLEMMPHIRERRLEFVKVFDNSVPLVMTDRNVVKIVLQNLLSNAVKYTPDGGRITLSSQNRGQGARRSRWPIPAWGSRPGEQSRIFTQFFRAPNAPAQGNERLGPRALSFPDAPRSRRRPDQLHLNRRQGVGVHRYLAFAGK